MINSILNNHLILENIANFLSLNDLRNGREVCKSWNELFSRFLRLKSHEILEFDKNWNYYFHHIGISDGASLGAIIEYLSEEPSRSQNEKIIKSIKFYQRQKNKKFIDLILLLSETLVDLHFVGLYREENFNLIIDGVIEATGKNSSLSLNNLILENALEYESIEEKFALKLIELGEKVKFNTITINHYTILKRTDILPFFLIIAPYMDANFSKIMAKTAINFEKHQLELIKIYKQQLWPHPKIPMKKILFHFPNLNQFDVFEVKGDFDGGNIITVKMRNLGCYYRDEEPWLGEKICLHFPNLRQLDISNNLNTMNFQPIFEQLQFLTKLNLGGDSTTDSNLTGIPEEMIKSTYENKVYDFNAPLQFKGISLLKELKEFTSDSDNITDISICFGFVHLPKLNILRIEHSTISKKMANSVFTLFKDAFKSLRSIDLKGGHSRNEIVKKIREERKELYLTFFTCLASKPPR